MNAINGPAALSVAWKDIKILRKERGALILLFVLPMIFILAITGWASGGSDANENVITLPLVNLDPASEASQVLIDALNQAGGIQVKLYDEAKALALLEKGEIRRVLTIPANYAADVEAGRPVTLRLVSDPDANAETTESVQTVVGGVATNMSLEKQLIASFQRMADMQAGAPSEQQVFTGELIVEQAQRQMERARTEPLVGVEETLPEHLLSEREDISVVDVAVPGFTVLFVFLTAQRMAMSIFEEKKIGSFRRLLAAPISKLTVLVGKLVPNFLTVLVQTVVIFGVCILLFPLLGLERLTLGKDPLALILLALALALCTTSLGVLISAVARTEAQIGGVSSVLLWVMGFGAFVPSFLLPPLLASIQRAFPHTWATEAFQDLIVRGQGLADIAPNILALLGFAVAFFGVGLLRFEFD
jgi:ABC-2 type transport system permease protein